MTHHGFLPLQLPFHFSERLADRGTGVPPLLMRRHDVTGDVARQRGPVELVGTVLFEDDVDRYGITAEPPEPILQPVDQLVEESPDLGRGPDVLELDGPLHQGQSSGFWAIVAAPAGTVSNALSPTQ